MFILPIVLYFAHCYEINNLTNIPLKSCYKCKLVTNKNSNLLLNLLDKTKNKFSLFGITDLSNILTLLDKKVYYIYILVKYNNPIAAYFYRNPMLKYNNNTVIELISSICECDVKLFYLGFIESYKNVSKVLNQKYIILEEISHNLYLNYTLKSIYTPYFRTPYSYYLYNYSHKILKPENVFLLI